jgi:virulence factor Mce-like protein
MSLRSPRTRTARRRTETASPRRVLVVAGISTAVVLLLVALSLSIYHGVPWENYKTIYATAPQTGDLIPHDPVKIAGVRVGQVSGISVDGNGNAVMKLQIDPGTTLPVGTGFELRANGLLGSRYVQLLPPAHPRGGELPSGTTLHGNLNTLTYGVPEALEVFNARTRGGLATTVTGLGDGLIGRGQGLNDTIHEIATESLAAQQLVAGVTGPGHLQALVPSLESLMVPLATARYDITALLNPANTTFQPFIDQRTAVRSTLQQAPSALDAANAGLATGERLLDAAARLSIDARQVLPTAPAGLRATTRLLSTSHPALTRTKALLGTADGAIPAVLKITGAVSPVLSPLSQGLTHATPIVNYVAPYGCNIKNFATVIRSMTGFGAADQPVGPYGPAMAFRLEIIPASPLEILGAKDVTGLTKRVGYAPPCHYLSTSYPTFTSPGVGTGTQGP